MAQPPALAAAAPTRLARFDAVARAALVWASARPLASAGALILLCLALYLPGFASLPVTDRDEARFAQASKQMLETGDFLDIRFQDAPRYKKPAGIYWLQSAAAAATGDGARAPIWAYRLPSLLGAVLAVLALWWAARPLYGRQTALLGAALLAASVGLVLEAHIAKSDAVLLATITLAQGALARLYLQPQTGRSAAWLAALFWVALGAGVLIKGPVAPGLAGLTIAALLIFDRRRGWLRRLNFAWGVPLFLAVVLPWFIAIGIKSDGAFFRLAMGHDFLGKVRGGQENHGAPPGTYFLLFWWTFWPGALLAAGGAARWLWRERGRRKVFFLLAWILPFWLAIEFVPTKLPHYALPLYPAIALAAAWIMRNQAAKGRLRLQTYKQAAAVWLIIGAAQVGVFGFALWYFGVAPSLLALVLGLGVAALTALTVMSAWRGLFHGAAALALASALIFYAAVFSEILPRLRPVWISDRINEAVSSFSPCIKGPVVLAGYHEPSAVFLLGTKTKLGTGQSAAGWLLAGPGRAAFVSARQEPGFSRMLLARATPLPRPRACISGFTLNGGRRVLLKLYLSEEAGTPERCGPPPELRCPAQASE